MANQSGGANLPKVLGIIIFFAVSLLGLVPIYVSSFRTNQKLISLTACFSAGLFISVGLMHILPEAQQDFESWHKEQEITHSIPGHKDEQEHVYPYAPMITILCFSLVLFIDKVMPDRSGSNN